MPRADSLYTVDVGRATKAAAAEQILEQKAVLAAATDADDAGLLTLAPKARQWRAGEFYAHKEPLMHDGQLYQVAAVGGVTALAHQAPGGEGMLALYRPVDNAHRGTKADPYLFVYGMDVKQGKHYSYNGGVWLWDYADTAACIWHPGQAGVHFWREV